MNYKELSKLIVTCREQGVSKIEMDETFVNVTFFGQNERVSKEEEKIQFVGAPTAVGEWLDSIKTNNEPSPVDANKEQQKAEFDEDMLHLIDPTQWETRELGKTKREDLTIAVGGDEEDGDYDV